MAEALDVARRYLVRSRLDPRIEIRPAATGGFGMFARAPIAAGEIVIEWGGTVLDAAALARTPIVPDSAIPIGEGVYMVTLAGDADLEDYYLNHSCDPNLWLVDAVTFAARRAIPSGAELTADYAYWQDEEDLVGAWICRCGSPFCRARVTGRDWRRPELQTRYRGHFSPFVNARIDALTRRAE